MMNHDHDTKPHAISSRSKSTYSRQVDKNGMQPSVELPSGKLITSSSWKAGLGTNMVSQAGKGMFLHAGICLHNALGL